MRGRFSKGAAWAGLVVGAALYGGGIVLGLLGPAARPVDYLLDDAAFFVPFFGFSVIGAVIAARRPGNPIGWILVGIGSLAVLSYFGGTYAIYGAGSLPGAEVLAWLATWIWIPAGGLMIFLLLLFPDGRLPSRRWHWLVWLTVVWFILLVPGVLAIWPVRGMALVEQGAGNVSAIPEGRLLSLVTNSGTPVLLLTALASLVIRFRHSRGLERQQLKWVAFASALLVVQVPVSIALPFEETVSGFLLLLALLTIPISIGIAVLRYRLYDIDRIISRTVTYALVVGLLGLIVLGLVAGLAIFMPSDDPLVVAVATLATAASFNPLRKRVHSAVDRRFNRSHFDAQRVVDEFSGTLRETADADKVVDGWVGVVEETMQPATVGVWVRE